MLPLLARFAPTVARFAATRPGVAAVLRSLKPTGKLDAAVSYGPDLLMNLASQAMLPQDASLAERAGVFGENLLLDTAFGTLGGRMSGAALGHSLARRRGLAPGSDAYRDLFGKATMGTEVGFGVGAGFLPRPLTMRAYEASAERAAQGQMTEQDQLRLLEQQQEQQQQQQLMGFANAGVGALRTPLYPYEVSMLPDDFRALMGMA